MFCPKCGTPVPEGMDTCLLCGAAVQPTAAAENAPAADTSNQQTMTFTPIVDPVWQGSAQTPNYTSAQTPNYTATQTPNYTSAQTPNYTSAQTPNYTAAQTPSFTAVQTPDFTAVQTGYDSQPKKQGNGGRVALIVAICVLILGILVTLGFLLLPSLLNVEDIEGGSSSKREPHSNHADAEETGDRADEEVQEDVTITESNPYYIDFVSEDTYVLSASDTKYYSRAELSSMTRQQLYLAERELFARYGGTFSDGDLAQFFGSKNWYTPDSPASNFNESRFTDIERVNLMLLRALLMERDGTASSNPYYKYNSDVEGFILPYTDTSRITKYDVEDLEEKELIIAYNEIYARKGYIFEDNDLQLYFSGKNWYTPTTLPGSFNTAVDLNEIEQDNYACLQQCREKVKGVKFSAGNKYKKCYNNYTEYVCPGSDTSKLSPYDLRYLDAEELMIARNEIYARYGYVYTIAELREYFMNCSWYYPTVANGKLGLIKLSATEEYNVKLLQAFELNVKLKKGEAKPNTPMSYYAKHDFLTMYLPEHWRDNCICIKPTGLSGNLVFYEKYNQEKGYGWLFSMELVPTDEGIPSYSGCYAELYGTVTTPEGKSYYVINVMPQYSDEQFLEEVYALMESQVSTIWSSIKWKSGYTFTPA